MKVLVINAGSSSLKYQFLDSESGELYAKGLCERIGMDSAQLKHTKIGAEPVIIKDPQPDHGASIQLVLKALSDPEYGVIKSMDEIEAVGHRILNCGDYYAEPVLINQEVKDTIEKCYDLAPLHNPANMTGILACEAIMPHTPMVAVFDTAFHQTMPPKAYMYGLPYRYYTDYHIRRYGAHGTSHRFVSLTAADFLGQPLSELRLITCHLGNGSSLAAVDHGKCVDTSMGLTPLSGPLMGTRCGDIDPAIVPFIQKHEGKTADEIDHLMNKESGVMAISGVSSDFRDLEAAMEKGNERARLALDMFIYQVKKILGGYFFALGGADAIVFTAGIGENDAMVRAAVCEGLESFGIKLDADVNASARGKNTLISAADSRVKVLLIPTNEELMIARDTASVVNSL